VTQVVPLMHITALEPSPHNPNLIELLIQDVLDASGMPSGRTKPAPAKLMRLSFDSQEMAQESIEFISAQVVRGWRNRKESITKQLCLPIPAT